MDELVEQATALRKEIKAQQVSIDNPALVIGVISALDFFVENVIEGEE